MRSTKEEAVARVIAAGRSEFSAHGLAGARIDVIAAGAKTSKERVYAYFASKEQLFRSILVHDVDEYLAGIVVDRHDLVGMVATMYDRSLERYEHVRMLAWARLAGMPFDGNLPTLMHAVSEIKTGQEEGIVDPVWEPAQLLSLLLILSTAWAQTPEPTTGVFGVGDHKAEREAVLEAARRVVTPLTATNSRHARTEAEITPGSTSL